MDNLKLTAVEALMLTIAIGNEYESEYCGHMGNYCAYCDIGLDDDHNHHNDDCEMLVARHLLGDTWTNHLAIEQKKEDELRLKEQKKAQKYAYDREKHTCKHCHNEVRGQSMKSHVNNNLRCLKLQGRAKTGTVSCLCCHKSMLAQELVGHFESKQCAKKLRYVHYEKAVFCICCHKVVDVMQLKKHYHSQACLKDEA